MNLFHKLASLLMAGVSMTLALTACEDDGVTEPNKYVTTFTSGAISRFEGIYLVLSDSVPQDIVRNGNLDETMSISPSVEGKFSFVNNHTIEFTPDVAFERDTRYKVRADIGNLFKEASGKDKKFVFYFRTLPLAFAGNFVDLEPTTDNGGYNLSFNIKTLDKEDSLTVRKSVRPSEGSASWAEEGDGTSHSLRVTAKAQAQSHELMIFDPNDSVIARATVPGTEEIRIYNVTYRQTEGQRYVEVSFTKDLDPDQPKHGLAYIIDNKNTSVVATGNKLRLFPDGGAKSVTVFVSGSIKSSNGITLGEDVIREIEVENEMPDVQFTSKGTIIPLSSRTTIPFRSIGMRGVRVRVFKAYKSNMGNWLQACDIDDYDHLARYGFPVAVKTIILEKRGLDLMSWHTYAIDLSDIMKAEKGTVYRIELEMDKDLSAWPNVEGANFDLKEIAAKDAKILSELQKTFNNGDMWYFPNRGRWGWGNDNDPSKASYYDEKSIVGRNVLATNLGLSAISDGNGTIRVFALNLPDATPRNGVDIKAYSIQNQLIGSAKTEGGMAEISFDPNRAYAQYLVAEDGEDVAYLRMAKGENLSTSTFDVSGEAVQDGGIKCLLYGERGVWRPGDEIHLTAMIQSDKALPADHPVTLELRTPMGTLYRSMTSSKGPMGVYTFNIPTEPTVSTGVWEAKALVGSATFTKSIRIETIKPNRLKIDLDLPTTVVSQTNAKLHTEWLTGAKAHNMKYFVTASMAPAHTSFSKFADYTFDDPTRSNFSTRDGNVASGATDDKGDAIITLNPITEGTAPGVLQASVTTKVVEPSGEFSIDVSRCLISPYERYAGLKTPQEGTRQLECGKEYLFSVASVDGNGAPQADDDLDVSIYKVEYWWWWSSSNDEMADYTAREWNSPVKRLTVKTGANGTASFKFKATRADWGVYLISVRNKKSGHQTGALAYFDWPEMQGRTPNGEATSVTLKVSTDKAEYMTGETMTLTFPSAKGANAIVNICRGTRVLTSQIIKCDDGKTSVGINVTRDMQPNAYAIVSLVQPYANTKNDNPIRLYGITQARVTSAESHIEPLVSTKDEVRPMRQMNVTVSEKNGRAMAYTLAVVDEGLLDLTHFKTPDPWKTFNAREALGLNIWDVYSNVAGAYGGRIESMFSVGGDEFLQNGPKAVVNRFTPMVYFDGPFSIGKGEKKTHTIDVPNYMGRVRVMVVASDGKASGAAEKSVKVSKPLMLLGTLPRQIGVGDKAVVSATVFANKAVGDVSISIETKNGVTTAQKKAQKINFTSSGDRTVSFEIEAGESEDTADVKLTCASSGETAEYATKIRIRNESSVLPHTDKATIAPGKSWTSRTAGKGETSDIVNTLIELSAIKPLNLASRIEDLVSYPHGCAEQTTSKCLAQLYLQEFAQMTAEQNAQIDNNIKQGLNRLATYATADGGVAYWAGNSASDLWCSAYAYLLYTEAEAKGFYVQPQIKKRLEAYLHSSVRLWKNSDKANMCNVAMALYALANDKKSEIGTMNRLREELKNNAGKRQDMHYTSADAYAWLTAAYARTGAKDEAKKLLTEIPNDADAAIRLIGLSEMKDQAADEVAEKVRKELTDGAYWMSTYGTSLAITSWHKYAKANKQSSRLKATVSEDGKTVDKFDSEKLLWTKNIEDGRRHNLKVENTGDGDMTALVTTMVRCAQGEITAQENGLKVDTEGMPTGHVKTGETFLVRVNVANTSSVERKNVALTFAVPAGMEITGIKERRGVDNIDVRDDRVLAYTDMLEPGQANSASITVSVSATYAGEYYVPAADARLMYDDKVQGNSSSGHIVIE